VGIEILLSVAAALGSLLTGFAFSSGTFRKFVRRLEGEEEEAGETYGMRLAKLTASLSSASSEVDGILEELAEVAGIRESAVRKLEEDLQTLETRERELQVTIGALERTPLPVAERFAELLEHSEQQSRRRDYLLFGAGVVVTTVIAIIIQLVAG